MKRIFWGFILTLLMITISHAAEVSLAWDANTEPYLAGYKIYYGNASRSYTQTIDVGNVTEYTVKNLPDGEALYFAATAYDKYKNESDYSNEVEWGKFDLTPPGNFRRQMLRISAAAAEISDAARAIAEGGE